MHLNTSAEMHSYVKDPLFLKAGFPNLTLELFIKVRINTNSKKSGCFENNSCLF